MADFIGVSNFFSGRVVEHGQDGLVVETDGGLRVVLPEAEEGSMEQVLRFCVRPERIALTPSESSERPANCFPGSVVNRSFLGGSVNYVITLSNREHVTVDLKNESRTHGSVSYSMGDSVTVAWHQDDCIILRD